MKRASLHYTVVYVACIEQQQQCIDSTRRIGKVCGCSQIETPTESNSACVDASGRLRNSCATITRHLPPSKSRLVVSESERNSLLVIQLLPSIMYTPNDAYNPTTIAQRGSSHKKRLSPVKVMMDYIDSLPDDMPIREELCSYQFWKAVRTEFLASLLLVVLGSSCLAEFNQVPPPKYHFNSTSEDILEFSSKNFYDEALKNGQLLMVEIKTCLVFAFLTASLTQILGHVSGCHMNPSITVSAEFLFTLFF